MPFFKKHNDIIYFAHIPKTGGTSVETFLQSCGYKMYFHGRVLSNKFSSKHHRTSDDKELKLLFEFLEPRLSFTVMRHPIERIISEYKWCNTKLNVLTTAALRSFIRTKIYQSKKKKHVNDNHIRPQTDFLIEGMLIYKFNDWQTIIKDLMPDGSSDPVVFPVTNKTIDKPGNMRITHEMKRFLKKYYKTDLQLFRTLSEGTPITFTKNLLK